MPTALQWHRRVAVLLQWRTRMIGKGSYGKVYEARWRGVDVAIK
eukprot:COSAG01_NODE_1114_length_11650_cov_28.837590_11_plen_44_part_00